MNEQCSTTMNLPLALPKCCTASRLGARFAGDMTKPEWQRLGRSLGQVSESLNWVMGDWINEAKRREWIYGESYDEAALLTGWSEARLRDVSSMANTFNLSCRHDKLSYEHHRTVRALPPREQKRWLDLAEKEELSKADLREQALPRNKTVKGGFNFLRVGMLIVRALKRTDDRDQQVALKGWLKQLISELQALYHDWHGTPGKESI